MKKILLLALVCFCGSLFAENIAPVVLSFNTKEDLFKISPYRDKTNQACFSDVPGGGVEIHSTTEHGKWIPGTFTWYTKNGYPGRTYRLDVEGKGTMYVWCISQYTYRTYFKKIFKFDGKESITFTLPKNADDYLRFDIGMDRKPNDPLILRSITIDVVPPENGAVYPDRNMLKASKYKGVYRMVAVNSLDQKKADRLKKNCVTTLRFFFRNDKGLEALKPSMECAAKNGFLFTLEYAPDKGNGKSSASAWFQKAYDAAAPFRKNVIAYGLFTGKWIEQSKMLAAELPAIRKIAPKEKLLLQPLPKAADYADFVPFDDPGIIYKAKLTDAAELDVMEGFCNMFPVTFLADRTELPWGCEEYQFSWSIREKDVARFKRPMHKNGTPEQQEASLLAAVKKVSKPGTIRFLFVTDVHLNPGVNKPLELPQFNHMKHMAQVAKKLKLDFFVNGGDLVEGNTGSDKSLPLLEESMKIMQSSGIPVFMIVGNHDEGGQSSIARNDPTGLQNLRPELWYPVVCKPALAAGAVGDPEFENAKYYYYDLPQSKVRVIFLATCANPMLLKDGALVWKWYYDISGNQLTWLARKAYDLKDKKDASEWNVLFIGHTGPSDSWAAGQYGKLLKAFRDGGKAKGAVTYPVAGSFDVDYSGQGPIRVLAYIQGDSHEDFTKQLDGYPLISCAQDLPSQGARQPVRRGCDEELWSVFVLNRKENKLHLFRFGAGCDRVIDLNSAK